MANTCYSQIFQTWLRAGVKQKIKDTQYLMFYRICLVGCIYLLQQGDLYGLKGKNDENVESVRFPTNILLATLLL